MKQFQRVLSGVLLGSSCLGGLACSGSDSPGGSTVEAADSAPRDLLAGDELDALQLLVVINSRSSASGWGRSLELSNALQALLTRYDGQVQFTLDMSGVTDPLLGDGAKTIIPDGAHFGGTVKGSIHVTVEILAGEVGVIGGQFFAADGTLATVNDTPYRYSSGEWRRMRTGAR